VATRKPRQAKLPEMKPEEFADIEEAARAYLDARDRRMEMTKAEVDTKAALLAVMKEHQLPSHEFDDYLVTLDQTAELHVRKKKKPKAADNGEQEEGGEEWRLTRKKTIRRHLFFH